MAAALAAPQISEQRATAVFLGETVVASSDRARSFGVVCAMRRREVKSRCPELLVLAHDAGRMRVCSRSSWRRRKLTRQTSSPLRFTGKSASADGRVDHHIDEDEHVSGSSQLRTPSAGAFAVRRLSI
ncbi:hypothetical protein [Amycolatopsis alba]|uniref:UmuC domain-containing protein n=1 Tax=Amycolatopsis alba DSM 44262 TaxID=1125972 RepID=A0A229RLK2_AMYAL|nr:hypothetical protein CFP75_23900 [Amycolatopsis alba DSM 44262]